MNGETNHPLRESGKWGGRGIIEEGKLKIYYFQRRGYWIYSPSSAKFNYKIYKRVKMLKYIIEILKYIVEILKYMSRNVKVYHNNIKIQDKNIKIKDKHIKIQDKHIKIYENKIRISNFWII